MTAPPDAAGSHGRAPTRQSRRLGGATAALGPAGSVCAAVVAVVVLVAALAPWLAPHDPNLLDLTDTFAGPSGDHWLGTDGTGRDVLSRLIWGARTSLAGPAMVVAASLVAGLPLALVCGWRGGRIDAAISRVLDVLFALPGVLIAVLTVAVFGPGLTPAIAALAVAYLPYVARTARAAAQQQFALPYVAALRVQGVGGAAIAVRHVLPNIAGVVMAQVPNAFALALIDLAALSFLGLGVQAPQPDWGLMVSDSQARLQGHPQQVIYAGTLIVVTVLALTFLGDRLAEGRGTTTSPRSWRRRRHRYD